MSPRQRAPRPPDQRARRDRRRTGRLVAPMTMAIAWAVAVAGPGVAADADPPTPSQTSIAAAAASPGADLAEQPPGTLQALVDGAPAGAELVVPPGRYRELVTIRTPVTLRGAGAEIDGADVWSSWQRQGDTWVSADTVPSLYTGGTCAEPRCAWPEQVFLDGAPLLQVERDPDVGEFARDDRLHIVLGDDPTGRTVEVSVRQHWIAVEAPDVTIADFTMRHVASAAQFGGIHAGAGADRLTIRGVALSDSHGALVSFHDNRGGSLLDSDLVGGGQIGVKGGGTGVHDLTIRGNRIVGSNTEGFETGWEAGGIKLTNATSPVIEENEVSDNTGAGIWCDIDCTDAVIRANEVHDNARAGIMFEISQGALIEDNVVGDNGWGFATWGWGAGILVSSSSGAVVRGNTVAWNADGIAVISQQRGRPSGDPVRDNQVVDNVVAGGPPGAYLQAWLEDWKSGMFETGSGNVGDANQYWIAPDSSHDCLYLWRECVESVEAFSETPGGTGAVQLTGTEAAEVLTSAGLAAPQPHELNDPPRLRTIVTVAVAGIGLAVLAVAIILLARRRRPDRPADTPIAHG